MHGTVLPHGTAKSSSWMQPRNCITKNRTSTKEPYMLSMAEWQANCTVTAGTAHRPSAASYRRSSTPVHPLNRSAFAHLLLRSVTSGDEIGLDSCADDRTASCCEQWTAVSIETSSTTRKAMEAKLGSGSIETEAATVRPGSFAFQRQLPVKDGLRRLHSPAMHGHKAKLSAQKAGGD